MPYAFCKKSLTRNSSVKTYLVKTCLAITKQMPWSLLLIAFFISFFISTKTQAQTPDAMTIDSANSWRQTHLTQSEQDWLAKYPVIRHGTRTGAANKPFEYTDEQEQHKGLTADYLEIISDKLGITIESIFRVDEKIKLVRGLQNLDIDLATYLHRGPGVPLDINFSKAIIKMPLVLLGRKNSPIIQSLDNITTERIIVQEKTHAHTMLKKYHSTLTPTFVDSVTQGIEAISAGDADIFVQNAFSLEYEQRKLGIDNIKILATTPYTYDLHFAVSASVAPLLTLFEKAINDISPLEKRLIFDKWINIEVERKIDYQLLFGILVAVITIIIAIVAFFTHWNRRLTFEVINRTTELRDLARHLNNVREEEKARLSREIHDELGHSLTGLVVGIKRLLALTTDEKCITKTKELNDLVLSASKTSKQIMTDLRPSILEDLGLVAAIDWLANDFKTKHGVSCKVNARDLPVKLKDEAAIALFRIVQESLTNIAKHACAEQVEIRIGIENNSLKLFISDDGQGLKAGFQTKRGSYGLKGMHERAMALGGNMKVTSESNIGVVLQIHIPINADTTCSIHLDK